MAKSSTEPVAGRFSPLPGLAVRICEPVAAPLSIALGLGCSGMFSLLRVITVGVCKGDEDGGLAGSLDEAIARVFSPCVGSFGEDFGGVGKKVGGSMNAEASAERGRERNSSGSMVLSVEKVIFRARCLAIMFSASFRCCGDTCTIAPFSKAVLRGRAKTELE